MQYVLTLWPSVFVNDNSRNLVKLQSWKQLQDCKAALLELEQPKNKVKNLLCCDEKGVCHKQY